MRRVFFVLVAHIFRQVPCSDKVHVYRHRPRLRVSLWVIDCHTNRKVAIVSALEMLGYVETISRWVPRRVEPNLSIETAGRDNEILAVPLPD